MTPVTPTRITAWRYQPGAELHPAARPGLPDCTRPAPCDRCGLSITAVVNGYVCILNPGEWLVIVEDNVALVMPDRMFQLVRGMAAIAPTGELVDDDGLDLDDLLGGG